MPSKTKALYLIDGHALAYRTYFALTAASGSDSASRWVTREGEPTAGTYGFTAVLFRLLEQDKPDYLAVSFDVGRTFRDDLFADYKGTRARMPDDLATQIERIREVVQAFNIPVLEAEGYEADDVLGSVARRAAAQGVRVVIVTGDRDLLQLADKRVHIQLSGQKLSEAKEYGPEEVKERYGLTPTQYIDFKALVGDKSDNIPGVAGVGEKTAANLLQEYGTLDKIYKNLDKVAKRFRTKLEEGRESAYLSKKLSTIVTDLDLPFDLEACAAPSLAGGALNFDRERVAELFRVLEFRSLLNKLPAAVDALPGAASGGQLSLFETEAEAEAGELPPGPTETETHIVDTAKALKALAARLAAAKEISFDVETTSTDSMRADLVGIALAVKEGEGYYVPVGHVAVGADGKAEPDGQLAEGQLPLAQVLEALRPALTDPAIPKIAHNAGYDYSVLKRAGLVVEPIGFDTMLGEWLSDPGSRNLGLKNLAWVRLGVEMTEITALIGRGAKQITMDRVPIAAAAPYAAADVDMTLRLAPQLRAELEEKNVLKLLTDLELPLIPVLAEMEMAGVALDVDYLAEMSATLQKRLAQIEKKIYAAVGEEFNLNSTQQLAKALFETLGLVPPDRSRKTSSGKYSTAADVLEDMRGQHPVIELILEHRELAKLKSTYIDALPQAVHPVTGRVHTSYNQAGSVTGRIASSDPNLQNIPIRTELGREVRKAFIAPRGRRLVAVDYSQIELRIAAHITDDEALLQAFHEGQDIHAATAAAVYGVPLGKVTKEQRRAAKAVNFGVLYGQSAFGLTRTTGLTLAESEDFIARYFERFPGIRRYVDETKQQARERGYVETLLGRRRYFPILQRPGATREDAIARSRAEREAINAPIQGTAADIIKLAMIRLAGELPRRFPGAQMLLQVHDELVFECATADARGVADLARTVMEGAYKLNAPLAAEARVGKNWEEMKAA
jgi:DNA polymerase I